MKLRLNEKKLADASPEEQKWVQGILAQYAKTLEENPLQGYEPHPKQKVFHEANVGVKAFIGANRTGKTTAGVADDLIQAVDTDCLPDELRSLKRWEPPFYCRIVTPDFSRTMAVIFQKIRELCPKHQLQGGSWDKAFDKQNRVLRFQNGSWFEFMTFEQDVDKFGGSALHRVHFDEEPGGPNGEAIHMECAMRLIDFDGDEMYTMTPLFGYSWVKDEVWDRRQQEGIFAIKATIWDNPYLTKKAIDKALAKCRTQEEYDARAKGEFVHFGGKFFDEFDDQKHVVDPPVKQRVRQQDIVCAIDPGLRRTGVVWIGFDSDNSALVFDELYPEEQVVAPIAAAIRQKNREWGIRPSYVIDPSARNRNAINADQIETEYAKAGIYCAYGQNDRAAGILEIKGRLQNGTLVISRDCRNLRWEIDRYRRDPNARDEWQAIKQDDHLVDALRYGVMSRVWNSKAPPKQRSPHYDHNFQRPYKEEMPTPEAAPLGAFT